MGSITRVEENFGIISQYIYIIYNNVCAKGFCRKAIAARGMGVGAKRTERYTMRSTLRESALYISLPVVRGFRGVAQRAVCGRGGKRPVGRIRHGSTHLCINRWGLLPPLLRRASTPGPISCALLVPVHPQGDIGGPSPFPRRRFTSAPVVFSHAAVPNHYYYVRFRFFFTRFFFLILFP